MTEQEQFLAREKKFLELRKSLKEQFGKAPDMNALLFLIGIRELGQVREQFTKEEKQDLMHIATCRLLSDKGYFSLEGLDDEGWPHWIQIKKLPPMSLEQQEDMLKECIIGYFERLD
ncbi:MAG TPA: hypothetical protein DCQ93_10195 [Bacteroidetes bacterium]|nr:hypothetical protein [Bacteroidota bacterium]